MTRILIVDDERDIRQMIVRFAQHDGYETREAADGREAVDICRQEAIDLVIMDIMMPGMDGFAACQAIRQMQDVPVLMLSARGEEYDKLAGFGLGIDDYVVKPFSPRELLARVKVIISRHQKQETPRQEKIILGGLRIEPLGRNVWVDDQRCELTAKEYDLLLYMAVNRGIVLTREQILAAVWGYAYDGGDRTVDWQIKLLRSKLGPYRHYIITIRGVGYKFEA